MQLKFEDSNIEKYKIDCIWHNAVYVRKLVIE